VMAGDVVPIARVRRRRLWCAQSGGVADDRGWLAYATPRSRAIRYIVFPECFDATICRDDPGRTVL
jgi:hypothetical protein